MDSSDNRQLAAITFIDIANFSELMHNNEKEAVHLLELQKDIVYPIISNYSGKILKEMGDGILVSFNSAIQAAKCSLEIQSKIEYIEKRVKEGKDIIGREETYKAKKLNKLFPKYILNNLELYKKWIAN